MTDEDWEPFSSQHRGYQQTAILRPKKRKCP